MSTAVAASERPVIMDNASIRAILDGRKTQFRRAVSARSRTNAMPPCWAPGVRLWCLEQGWVSPPGSSWLAGPWGKVMRLDDQGRLRLVDYAADDPSYDLEPLHVGLLPRWAARIVLELTAVRVERLQDITHRGCVAEGWPGPEEDRVFVGAPGDRGDAAIAWFVDAWDKANRARKLGWDTNPHVWVMDFRRLEP